MKSGPREYEAIDQRHAETSLLTVAQRAQRSVGGSPVYVDGVPDPAVRGRYDMRGAAGMERELADQCFVENRVDPVEVMVAPAGASFQGRSGSGIE